MMKEKQKSQKSPDNILRGYEREKKFKTFRLAIAGPPHSGKSVFLSSLVERLPEGCNIFRANPDGEGDWSQRSGQDVAAKLREKEKFSDDFVRDSIRMIKDYRNKVLLVDTGGNIEGRDLPLIFDEVDEVCILSQEDKVEAWEAMVKGTGKKITAVIASSLEGTPSMSVDEAGILRARIKAPGRGEKLSGEVMDRLSEILRGHLAEYSEDERVADIRFGDLAKNIGAGKHAEGGRFEWKPENLLPTIQAMRESQAMSKKDSIKLWGVAPTMVWCAIAAAARPREIEMHEPFGGYIKIPRLSPLEQGSESLSWKKVETEDYTFVKYQIPGVHFGNRKLNEVCPPAIDQSRGVVIAGKGPWWLTFSIHEAYADVPWIALVQPQITKWREPGKEKEWETEHPGKVPAVVTYSRTPDKPIGTVIPLQDFQHESRTS